MYTINSPLILASSSPRRKDLLEMIGLDFKIEVSDVDESVLEEETPMNLVVRLAELKGREVSKKNPEAIVISADTIVVLGDEILGKPKDQDDAKCMLRKIQGTTHQVFTAFALSKGGECVHKEISVSDVTMRRISDDEIAQYVATGEPMDKAGSYALQGIGASFVIKINGSYTAVIGLDVVQVVEGLKKWNLIS